MEEHLKDFWRRLQTGVEVAVAGSAPERLLGVRDAFLRYFQEGLHRQISVAVVPQSQRESPVGLAVGDEAIMRQARDEVYALRETLGDAYHFYVATEGGISTLDVGEESLYFVRNWTVLLSPLGESWGGSGSVQLPDSAVANLDRERRGPTPGTRRSGGIISSLTGGLETRRKAVALSTFHALSTLFYGVLQSRALPLH